MRYLVVLLAMMFPAALLAAPITVKSGDHESFTRLVLYLDGQDWNIANAEGLTTVTITGWEQGFDISDIYNRIDTERLRSLTASNQSLVMALGCECSVVAEEISGGLLSIDIHSKSVRKPIRKPKSATSSEPIETVPARSESEDLAPIEWPVVFEDQAPLVHLDRNLDKASSSAARRFESNLSAEIARNATLDYLYPSGFTLDRSGSFETEAVQDALLDTLSKRAKFSNAGQVGPSAPREKKLVCPAEKKIAVSNWGGEKPFVDQLSEVRARLYSEFDAANENATQELARLFVHYGLSDELSASSTFFSGLEELALLVDLAKTIEGDPVRGMQLEPLLHCEGETGFWAFLSQNKHEGLTQEMVLAHVAVFQILPRHLQELVADRVVNAFENQGFETAAGVVRSVLRGSVHIGDINPPVTLNADLGTLAYDDLVALVERNDALSPNALSTILSNAIKTQNALPKDILELAESFAHQLAGTDVGRAIKSDLIGSLAIAGLHADAISMLFDTQPDLIRDPNKTAIGLVEILLPRATSAEISKLVWRITTRDSFDPFPDYVRLDLAAYFEAHGQPQLAISMLENLAQSREVTALRARALAQSGQRSDAIALLSREGESPIGSRLSEIVLDEDAASAWELRDRLSGRAVTRAAWVSQNWQNVPADDVRGTASNLIANFSIDTGKSEKPIADAQLAFSNSKNARKVLDELLN